MKRLALSLITLLALASTTLSALKLDPSDLINKSREAFDKRDYQSAAKILTQAIQTRPDFAPAYILRGAAHGALKKMDAAISDFSEAIKLIPNDPRPYILRASAYADQDKHQEAIKDYTQAIGMDPKNTDLYCDRGMTYGQIGEKDKALADFEKAVETSPNDLQSRQLRANAYAQIGEKDKALADFEKAIQIDPKNPATYLWRAHLYLLEKQPELALSDFEEAMHRAPNYSGILNDYAWTLATNPKDSVRDGHKAVTFAKKACHETDYKHPPTLDTLAAAYAEAGNWEEAVKWQTETINLALKSDPKELAGMKDRLDLYKNKKPYREEPKRQ